MSLRDSLLTLRVLYRLKPSSTTTAATKRTEGFSVVSSFSCSRCHTVSSWTMIDIDTNYGRQISSHSARTTYWNSNLYCYTGHSWTCNFSRNAILISLLKRDFSQLTPSVLQKDPGKSNGDGDIKNGITNSKEQTPTKDEKLYDVAFGQKENKGRGEAERPVFIPQENKESAEGEGEEDIEPPTNCCQSGCPNCVWIDYVEKLTKKYTDPKMSREKVLKELDSLDDQNIKAFIMMELRTRKLI